jgi:hypothetical protein
MTVQPKPPIDKKQQLRERISKIAVDGPAAVDRRLDELGCEWTTGRLVKAASGAMLLAGLLPARRSVGKVGLALMLASGATLAQYWICKRSWLADVFAQLGVRSGTEIEDERIALRILRGDFRDLPTLHHIEDDDAMSRMADEGGPAYDPDDDKVDPKRAAELIVQQTR